MSQDRITALFFELFSGLPRQGPGDAASTLRALSLVPGIGPHTRVLDIGCGTGLQTRVLARNTAASFVAIDNYAPFVEELNREAAALGIADRLVGRVEDMRTLDFAPGAFDLIWCEGAIYVMGLESGLSEWRRFLAPGGHVALTEVCWTRPAPPAECAAFWEQEYPAIRNTPALLEAIRKCGYEPLGHFALPQSAWWDDYYRPLQQRVIDFRRYHRGEVDAQDLADHVQREIDIWLGYSEFYNYEFFVLRLPEEIPARP